MENPSGSFDPEGSLPEDLTVFLILPPGHYRKG